MNMIDTNLIILLIHKLCSLIQCLYEITFFYLYLLKETTNFSECRPTCNSATYDNTTNNNPCPITRV